MIELITGVIIPTIKHPFFSTACLLFGWLIGNRMAIDRDRRKEFNTVIEPIRNKLIQSTKQPGIDIVLNEANVLDIRDYLCVFRRRGFDNAVAKYHESINEKNRKDDGMGGFSYIDSGKITHASKNLLKYVKKR